MVRQSSFAWDSARLFQSDGCILDWRSASEAKSLSADLMDIFMYRHMERWNNPHKRFRITSENTHQMISAVK